MLTPIPPHYRRVRSFVRRDGRMTAAQEQAHSELGSCFGLTIENGMLHYHDVFHREAPRFIEIGFGTGQSLLALAKSSPEKDFIGVETHKPGIGSIFLGIKKNVLTNLRIYYGDVVEVLEKCIPDASLDGVQIFFPDPWPKRRHHTRRLIQVNFVNRLIQKLKPHGTLHLATDWEDYSVHMMRVLSQIPQITNMAGCNQFATRSPYRPILTKFERRAEREGRSVWELQFQKL